MLTRSRLAIITAFIFFTFTCHSKAATLLPTEYFANLPDVSNVSLSPGGTKTASKIRIDVNDTNGSAVQISSLETGDKKIVLFSDNSKYFINYFWWKDNVTLLVHTWYPSERDTWVGFTQARYKTRETRLLIVNTETGTVTSPFKATYLRKFKLLPSNLGNIINHLPNDPKHILISSPSISNGFPSSSLVHKINIVNQKKSVIQRSKNRFWGWGTDQQNRIRLAHTGKDAHNATMIKNLATGKWEEYWPYTDFSEDEVWVKGFDKDPNIVYINAYHNDRLAVFRVDLRDKDLKRELMYADENYDVTGSLIYSSKTEDVIGIGGTGEDGTKFFTREYKALQAGIDKALPDTRNFIYSITSDEKNYIVYSTGPTESGTYYLGTRNPTTLKPLAYKYKNLPPNVLSPVERIEYQSRDGLTIEGYLTTPAGKTAKNLPTLMFPHGGPISRDSRAFDYWAQFFASRGYAVLQMNFRGGGGQGLKFRNSGLKKWGKEMQDDIEDGALALIERGITNPDKICIVGASYGGYAALMGVTKTPDRYQCAISVNGVSNVKKLVVDNRAFWRSYNIVEEMIGDDLKELKAISPAYNADKITAPILLIHGELDRQVEIEHSYQMRDALIKAGKDVTFIEQAKEDHYLSNEANRIDAFKAMEDFLNTHLPVN